MEFKGTKSKWHNNGLEIRGESGIILANVYKHLEVNQSKDEAEANAKLIAAAPELLEALQEYVNCHAGPTSAYSKAVKAINKALDQ